MTNPIQNKIPRKDMVCFLSTIIHSGFFFRKRTFIARSNDEIVKRSQRKQNKKLLNSNFEQVN